MQRSLDLNHVRYFVAVVNAGSFAGAARTLSLPTSNLSRHIGQLEERLGSRLLERSTRHLRMTEQGRLLFDRAGPMMEDMLLLEAELQHDQRHFRGTLKLCLPGEFGSRLLGPIVAEFAATYPEVAIECAISMSGDDALRGDLDLAIGYRRGIPDDSTVIQQPLLSLGSVVVAAPALLQRCAAPTTVKQLAKLPCIATLSALNGAAWHFVDANGRQSPVPVQARYRVDSGEMARSAALAGIGFAILAQASCQADLDSGALLPVPLDLPPVPLELVASYPSRRHIAAKTRALLNLIQQRLHPAGGNTASVPR